MKKTSLKVLLAIFLGILLGFSLWRGYTSTNLHLDYARDLNELSELWLHRIVWLGPQLRSGFPASPMYFYLLFPLLVVSRGSAYSLVLTQAIVAAAALMIYAYLNRFQTSWRTFLFISFIALSPWWVIVSSLSWNGYLYVPLVLLAVVLLWFQKNLTLISLAIATACAVHPAAVVVLPLFLYELVRRKPPFLQVLGAGIAALIPLTPLILFEAITKGYLYRQWISHPNPSALILGFNPQAYLQITAQSGLSLLMWAALLIFSLYLGNRRERWWILMSTVPLILFFVTRQVQDYYVFGLLALLMYSMGIVLSKTKIGSCILLLQVMFFMYALISQPVQKPSRTIEKIQNTAAAVTQFEMITKSDPVAVISILDSKNSGPQADDYRFFLRIRGYNAVSIPSYPTAKYLILFVEEPTFDWQRWSDWHTDYFGSREFVSTQTVHGISLALYKRK